MVHREENDEPRVGLPSLPGTYVLVLRFSKRLEIVAGKLGVLAVQPGFYVYVGSALGPGGLAARVGRHCRREKTRRWHDDYLRAEANLEEVWYAAGKSHRECQWASAFRTLPGASVPLTGFGASDCGCHPISSTSRCRLPWPIFGRSCKTRRSNGSDWWLPKSYERCCCVCPTVVAWWNSAVSCSFAHWPMDNYRESPPSPPPLVRRCRNSSRSALR